MPRRVKVSRCTPPTPPSPAIATRLLRSTSCSSGVIQPILRSKACEYENTKTDDVAAKGPDLRPAPCATVGAESAKTRARTAHTCLQRDESVSLNGRQAQ